MADIAFTGADIVIDNDEIMIMENSVPRELAYRLDTPKGSHWYYLDYGNGSAEIIGQVYSRDVHMKLANDIKDCIEQDERIEGADVIIDVQGSNIEANININGYEVRWTI